MCFPCRYRDCRRHSAALLLTRVQAQDRQCLMELSQSVLFLERAGVNARRMAVSLPQVLADGARVVWCPRCPRGTLSGRSSMIVTVPSFSAAAASRRATMAPLARSTSASSSSSRPGTPVTENCENTGVNAAGGKPTLEASKAAASASLAAARRMSSTPTLPAGADSDSVTLSNRLPKWNDDINSLTMKFLGSRVAQSSSKNFLFELPTPEGTLKPVIQFGKLCPATFSLDFRYPLCPVQAFGLFLSANAWTIAKS